jgi:energy-coupling factor transporter ATP-binding protein EcfA2
MVEIKGEYIMANNLPLLVVVQGPQGSGKSTVTNWLREMLTHTQLLRLTGNNDKTKETGLQKITRHYENLLDYLRKSNNCGFNFLFDGIFTSEQAFCLCGYKEYDFTGTYEKLLKEFDQLSYQKILINLYLKDTSLYEERLRRDKPSFHDVKFSVKESIKQQMFYDMVANSVDKGTETVDVYRVDASTMDSWKGALNLIFAGLPQKKQI